MASGLTASFYKYSFIGAQPRSFIYVLYMTAKSENCIKAQLYGQQALYV